MARKLFTNKKLKLTVSDHICTANPDIKSCRKLHTMAPPLVLLKQKPVRLESA